MEACRNFLKKIGLIDFTESKSGKGKFLAIFHAPVWLVLLTVLFAVVFIGVSVSAGLVPIVVMFFFWVVLLFVMVKFAITPIYYFLIVLLFAVGSYFYSGTVDLNTSTITSSSSQNTNQDVDENNAGGKTVAEVTNKNGEIYVEAETGTLTNAGQYSRIATNTSRGNGEAYLGDGGAKVSYVISLKDSRKYVLWISITDDNKHADGARDAMIDVNGDSLHYDHVSKDTNGWEWVKINNVYLKNGNNEISFTKDKTTSAAFIMDAFKFVPVK